MFIKHFIFVFRLSVLLVVLLDGVVAVCVGLVLFDDLVQFYWSHSLIVSQTLNSIIKDDIRDNKQSSRMQQISSLVAFHSAPKQTECPWYGALMVVSVLLLFWCSFNYVLFTSFVTLE